jgi:peptidoglycan biosynthesis protein MviN/MurJ (putative lipid II flippase)
LFNWVFTFRLGWGYRGLAFSTGCIATFNFLLLYGLMRRHLHGLESRRMLGMLGKVAVASAALMAVCAASSHWLLAGWETQPFLMKLGALLATIIVGALVFAGCGAALHIQELREVQGAIRRRLRRGA